MRRLLVVLVAATAMFAMAGLLSGPAFAHPLGNFTVNRYSGIELSPGRVEVLYVLDLAEIPTFKEMRAIDVDHDGSATAVERQAWADRKAKELVAGMSLQASGRQVSLRLEADAMRFRQGQAGLPILRLEATFAGSLPTSGSIDYRDRNYGDRIGWKEITIRSRPGVGLTDSTVGSVSVSHALLAYPRDLLSSPLDVSEARASFRPGEGGQANAARAASGPVVIGAPVASGGGFASLAGRRLSPVVLVLALGLALAFGALHALGPGHGKTITAAYLVGSGARVRTAVAAGVAVSVMHTASVVVLGLVALVLLRSLPAEHVYPWLGLLTGIVAIGLGAGLLVLRVRARLGSADRWHGHAHDHRSIASRRGLAALAVAGGILPSPTAIVVLTAAISYHRLAYGLALIAAFSVGLATALVAVGLLALRARSLIAARLRGRWASLVPLASAAVIMAFGLFFAARGASQVL